MKTKQTSLRKRIVALTLIIVIVPLLILVVFSEATSYSTATKMNRNYMEKMTNIAANYVKADFDKYIALAESAGCNARLADPDISDEEKLEIMTRLAEQYGAKRGNLVKADGTEITQHQDFSDREYYKKAMEGKSHIYEPTVSQLTGEIIEVVAAPLWKDGEYGTTPVGCTYFITEPEYINDIMRELNISENSYAFILDSQGRIIAHSDSEKVLAETEEPVSSSMQSVYDKMIAGESGSTRFKGDGGLMVASYAPIEGTNGWSLAVCAKEKDFLGNIYFANTVSIVILVVAIAVSIFFTLDLAKRVSNPIIKCADRLDLVANGDLSSDVPVITAKDETKVLADSTGKLVTNLKCIINDVDNMLSQMADGNFEVSSGVNQDVYCGEFNKLLESMLLIKDKLTQTLGRINESADSVANESDKVSGSAESLSATSEELAASFEELNSSIHTITEKVNTTAQNCDNGRNLVVQTSEYAEEAVNEMTEMKSAMEEIDRVSQEIDNIIKTIEDISFQTNILALNAAIEAAHAGEAGKGFAVVADEVRNLAAKSGEAATSTTELIQKTIAAVQNGTEIAQKTFDSVTVVKERTADVENIMSSIASDSEQQSQMINQINQNFDNISSAIQQCASTATESAEAAHSMTEQSEKLRDLVDQFRF